MPIQPLTQVLILLTASVVVIALARRAGLPAVLGYLIVGILLGPLAFGLLPTGPATHALADIGLVFLLFTLGLEFSWPRMVALRREVFGLGSLQVLFTGVVGAVGAHLAGMGWTVSAVVGGALGMCSTAIVVRQLSDQAELNRTHGRLSFAVLLFQDLAFVPLLAVATSLAQGGGGALTPAIILRLVVGGIFALLAVFVIGRWVLRPLLQLIAHSQLRELFTLAALLVVLSAAWITDLLGLSMALGAFLAGMLFAESEYRHQIDAVIRPFRELLLGLFFISVGTLLDVRVLVAHFYEVIGLLALLVVAKTAIGTLVAQLFVRDAFKAMRTGMVLGGGGEFGIALLTLLVQGTQLMSQSQAQPLLAAVILSMMASPLLIRYNKPIARFLLRQQGPPTTAVEREQAATRELVRREHLILCGFGRVGRHIARVLVSYGLEYIAIDLDPTNVRAARAAGEPVVWGDSTDAELLINAGLDSASAVIVTFANPAVAIGIVRAARRLRADVPILVRTQDDSRLAELTKAGATEVVPETFEASLTLVSHALTLLHVPPARAAQTVDAIRAARYATLRTHAVDPAEALTAGGDTSEAVRSIVLSPKAWAVGRSLDEVRERGAEVAFTAVRRQGITGRDPGGETQLREGDIVVIFGTPEALEHAEAVLLAG